MTDMDTTALGVSNSPNFDAVQAMPLDTAKAQVKFISNANPNADFVVPDGVKLVEIVVVAQLESVDMVHLFHSDKPDATPYLSFFPVCQCAGTTRITYSLGESRNLSVFLVPPTSGSAMVAILGA